MATSSTPIQRLRFCLAAFGATRALLLLAGWLGVYFPRFMLYQPAEVPARGWAFVPLRLLDIWARWDSAWYYSVVENGYQVLGDIRTVSSNIAFFPLYPYLVKIVSALVPTAWRGEGYAVVVGVILANLALVGALYFLYTLALEMTGEEAAARRAVIYLLIFPSTFFLSSFYAESLFLLLLLASFYLSYRRQWLWAGVLGGLAALTRPVGVLAALPLAWFSLESIGWDWRKIRPVPVGALALIPLSLLSFLLSVYPLTGELLAPLTVQQSWGRSLAWPWVSFFAPVQYNGFYFWFEQAATLGMIGLTAYAFRRFSSPIYGLFAMALLASSLFSGTLMATGRHYLMIFPAFVVLGVLGRSPWFHRVYILVSLFLLLFFMVLWSQFYTIL